MGATSQQRLNDAGDIFKGLTVGQVAAVKYLDPRTNREELRFAFIFNGKTAKPTVAFLPKNVELEGVRPDIASLIAKKALRFDEFMGNVPAEDESPGEEPSEF